MAIQRWDIGGILVDIDGYWWGIGGWDGMVGRRYFSGNPKVGQSGKSRQVATLHPGTPPAKREGCPLLLLDDSALISWQAHYEAKSTV